MFGYILKPGNRFLVRGYALFLRLAQKAGKLRGYPELVF